jgi:predicted Zn-dependent protease
VRAGRARAALDAASTLNPDRTVDLDRALLWLERSQPLKARRIALSVTHAEPENLEAWVRVAQSAGSDPSLFKLALDRVSALEPRRP